MTEDEIMNPSWKREDERLARFIAADDLDRQDARSFVPDVSVRKFVAGDFLCYWKLEVPRKFIESIEPHEFAAIYGPGGNGIAPRKSFHDGSAVKAACAGIRVRMHSGQTHNISCNRWQVDTLLAALRDAWKHGLGVEEGA